VSFSVPRGHKLASPCVCFLSTQFMRLFCVSLIVNGYHIPKQHWPLDGCYGDAVCFLWGTDWIFKMWFRWASGFWEFIPKLPYIIASFWDSETSHVWLFHAVMLGTPLEAVGLQRGRWMIAAKLNPDSRGDLEATSQSSVLLWIHAGTHIAQWRHCKMRSTPRIWCSSTVIK
jgi:hypothetical protein